MVMDCGLSEIGVRAYFLEFFGNELGFWVYSEGE